MIRQLSDVVYETETNSFWVLRYDKGYKVYRSGFTHSTLCATIAYTGERGLTRAISEADRRERAPK